MTPLAAATRIVLKVGTTTLTGGAPVVDPARITAVAEDIAAAVGRRREVLLVSSGAIVTGAGLLGRRRPRRLIDKQAFAAVGQPVLMQRYSAAFDRLGLRVAQILLTRQDFEDRRRYVNARQTLLALLAEGVVPVINENDTIATDEIQIGDNDTLSALVASLVAASLLVVLSDVEGLMTADPRRQRGARLIPTVERIDARIVSAARRTVTAQGVGGMATKVEAARIATESGVATVVTGGAVQRPLARLLSGERLGTLFLPAGRFSGRGRWLAFGLVARGTLVVDDGASAALRRGKSLLPAGIVGIGGTFDAGEAVTIADGRGQELARGLVNYSSANLARIQGRRSSEIARLLGDKTHDEVVHRDNLVVTAGLPNGREGGRDRIGR
ncbi:MAG TPA: glutamate 5-kinase [bacterium]|nr:glutamate 5-kinase [bacterium]